MIQPLSIVVVALSSVAVWFYSDKSTPSTTTQIDDIVSKLPVTIIADLPIDVKPKQTIVKEPVWLVPDNANNLLNGDWLVYLTIPWSPSCQRFNSKWNAIRMKKKGINSAIVDVEKYPELAIWLNIYSFPHVLEMREGEKWKNEEFWWKLSLTKQPLHIAKKKLLKQRKQKSADPVELFHGIAKLNKILFRISLGLAYFFELKQQEMLNFLTENKSTNLMWIVSFLSVFQVLPLIIPKVFK